ncbi:spondin domain-containing protein [Mesorhizobium sp.]|uniref:spondin domain-containing protein n=1 Tax=Mesorhizobium sp. TaxID=1871066 RepID=UPI000FE5319E|nr:spondin domain-containing protein [Mesorhizobium sp.]RWK37394.1 MAG: hypothetical protein EOR46_25835 [Mesorhizobium sp.]RWK64137.1 MAG: hypothetical protein EOR54_28655 [Mesorhizobium sp.]RWK72804.1 MAG: hypothetical protein EOR50_26910 [Mesorhizobium sp.]RWK81545.1 MAG: hypothetical protein EOR51_15855 [Mesorhizobium sp.]RWL01087.1 MAG: hypothetical protein EOR55_26690 [Mesorhizobium sp.]
MRDLLKATVLMTLAVATGPIASVTKVQAADVTTFSITIRNVSGATTLALPDGNATSAPIAPGLYAVVRGEAKLFTPNQAAGHSLESLAEDGDAAALLAAIKHMDGVVAADMFAPGLPLTVKAEPGDRLVFGSMFVQSNDKFFATDSEGIDLFEGQYPVAGDLTSKVVLWDAGTEKDEAPGAGPNQAPRQAGPNTGPDEHGVIRAADDGFAYPAVSDVIQLTVRPQGVKSKLGS